jgi:hypothetical protein
MAMIIFINFNELYSVHGGWGMRYTVFGFFIMYLSTEFVLAKEF